MKKPKIFLDFDETLFNHMAMLDWIDSTWEQHYGTPAKHFSSTVEAHHTQIDDIHRLYRHREHYELSGRPWEDVSATMSQMIKEQGMDFCYPEVHAVLESLVKQHMDLAILTYGDEEYQLYKINQCPVLNRLELPVLVVDKPKRDYLAKNFKDTFGVLVDDKHPLHLPSNWHHIWVNRTGKTVKLSVNETEVTDLSALTTTLSRLY